MKITINKFKLVKTPIEPIEVTIPTEPIYFFWQRKSIAVIPEWTTWKMSQDGSPEEIYQLHIIIVSTWTKTIELHEVSMNPTQLAKMLDTNNPTEVQEILRSILEIPEFLDTRTQTTFMADYNNLIASLNDILPNQ